MATIGEMSVVRHAGTDAAVPATKATTAVDAANGCQPKLATSRNLTSSQTPPTSAIDPTATPATESFRPPPRTSATRSRCDAPRAIRVPSSMVRCRTKYDITP
jgi:hypothetical protein